MTVEKKLILSICVTIAVLFIELFGSYLSGSLSLLADSLHMFTDAFALFLVWFALKLARQLPTKTRTFGLHRYEIIVTLINGILLLILVGTIMYEAYHRLSAPRALKTVELMLISFLGLCANLWILFKLKHHTDITLRSAWLHVLGDSLSSVAVFIGGVWIHLTGMFFVDTLLSVIIAIVLLISTVALLKDALNVLLQYTPRGINLDTLVCTLKKIKGIKDLHHLHLWSLCPNVNVLSAHVVVTESNLKKTPTLLKKINTKLTAYNIKHATIQFECEECSENTLLKEVNH